MMREAMKAVTAAAQAEFVRLTVSTVRRRARVGRGGRVLVDRYGSHIVPKAVPPPDSKPSSHVRPASPRPTAQRQASFTGRVRYASQARVSAPPLSTPKKARGTARAGWFSLTDDGYSSSSSDCDSVNEAPQIIPEAPPPPPPPEPETQKSQPCAACRGAQCPHTCGRAARPPKRRRQEAREAAEKIAAAAAASQAVDALAPADVGRTRGGDEQSSRTRSAGTARPSSRRALLGRGRGFRLPGADGDVTCQKAGGDVLCRPRLAWVVRRTRTRPADQPDLPYTDPGAPRMARTRTRAPADQCGPPVRPWGRIVGTGPLPRRGASRPKVARAETPPRSAASAPPLSSSARVSPLIEHERVHLHVVAPSPRPPLPQTRVERARRPRVDGPIDSVARLERRQRRLGIFLLLRRPGVPPRHGNVPAAGASRVSRRAPGARRSIAR